MSTFITPLLAFRYEAMTSELFSSVLVKNASSLQYYADC